MEGSKDDTEINEIEINKLEIINHTTNQSLEKYSMIDLWISGKIYQEIKQSTNSWSQELKQKEPL